MEGKDPNADQKTHLTALFLGFLATTIDDVHPSAVRARPDWLRDCLIVRTRAFELPTHAFEPPTRVQASYARVRASYARRSLLRAKGLPTREGASYAHA